MAERAVVETIAKFKAVLPLKAGITVDDGWDQLNRKFMFILLCVFGVVVTLRQYTGHVISCEGFRKFNQKFTDDYCWTQGLYTILEAYDQPLENVPYPGIVPEDMPKCVPFRINDGRRMKCPDPRTIIPPSRVFHLWYQWVPFYFFTSALSFYMPYLFYKNFGMGEMKPLINLLYNPIETEEGLDRTMNKASTWLYYYFSAYVNKPNSFGVFVQRHKLGFVIVFVKCLYMSTSVGIFYLTSKMFELGNYLTYGRDWILTVMEPTTNYTTAIRDKLFPKMASCEIKRWGLSGMEEEQGICVLAPNVINQYLFLLLWFALCVVICSNGLSLLLTGLKLFFTYGSYRKLLMTAFIKDDQNLKKLYYQIGVSGRIVLHILASSVRPKVFEHIVRILVLKLRINKSLHKDMEDTQATLASRGFTSHHPSGYLASTSTATTALKHPTMDNEVISRRWNHS